MFDEFETTTLETPGAAIRAVIGGHGPPVLLLHGYPQIHASCEDYRAAASIDLARDQADLTQKLECPVLALWGAAGAMEKNYDVLAAWREPARDVRGGALACGHYLPEEAPEETESALARFLAG